MNLIATDLTAHGSDHYGDVIKGTIPSQITSLTIIYLTVYSGADQRKYQCSASLAFMITAQKASHAEKTHEM